MKNLAFIYMPNVKIHLGGPKNLTGGMFLGSEGLDPITLWLKSLI
jgi:hypothetical protein